MKITFIINILLFCFLLNGKAQTPKVVSYFPLQKVKLLESPFLNAQQKDLQYILAMEPDRLLAPYLREAGLTPKAPSYTNWENTGLDGHIGGHYLSALSMMYASTGNEEMKQRLDYMIDELKKCQDAVGTGFIGGTPGSIPMWKEIKEGNIRASGFGLNGKWVPLYNIHKTYAGLRDAYLFAGNETAKELLIKLTDWMIDITGQLSDEQMQDMLRSEHGGLNETFADVYEITGDKKYLTLAKRFSHLFILNPLLEKKDKLTGLHANTQIPKVIGYKRIADLEGNKAWDDASSFFWQTVIQNRSVSIGGNSVREHFHSADNFEPMVTDIEGPETCNTYNMLRLSNMFYQTTCDTHYLDYYERALYNHILSSQEPEKGGFVYFTSMRPGHYRVYSQPHTSMWCCVGSGLENHTKYGELIYAHTDDALFVNLFIPSRLQWDAKKVVLTQETRFPDEEEVRIRIEESKKKAFTLHIRYPNWVDSSKAVSISINGKKVEDTPTAENGYISLHRKWKKGDEVTIQLPMSLTMEQLPDQSNFYSFKYGPIVLAAKMGTEDLKGLYADDSRGGHIAHGKQIPLQNVPLLVGEADQLLSFFRKQEDKLAFTYTGTTFPEKTIEFIPFFRLHNARYAVYFRQVTGADLQTIKEEITKREEVAARLAARTVDLIYPGEQQPESDHFIKYEDSQTGTRDNRHFRSAKGWFGYELKVKDTAESIALVLHKKDRNPDTRILINDVEIVSEPSTSDIDENFIRVMYKLPQELKEGVHQIKFMPKAANSETARIYEVRLIK
ncbi:glycoside hydrolase family 127 protein [Bacteroides sp. 224]|uniref:glycoside hydrolase family 127 protein n=1 Tax=Bacteroides sp. 224 TaxID=2302936 RepID=UPI0013D80853|nr:glycoside hydrolase family 127 protein [Bacteroides sp. 224]NDV66198.1 glycosyl hydrolase [Bacteroides sp. 224]